MRRRGGTLAFATVAVFLAAAARSEIVIDVGDHVLAPDAAGQKIVIDVGGGLGVAGLNFIAQIEDGFPDVPGGLRDGPDITDVDLISDAMFSGNHTGPTDPGSGGQLALRCVTTRSGTAAADGTLATVTIDTTGIEDGVFRLRLKDTAAGSTTWFDARANPLPATMIDGRLLITPLRKPMPTPPKDLAPEPRQQDAAGWIPRLRIDEARILWIKGEPGADYLIETCEDISNARSWRLLSKHKTNSPHFERIPHPPIETERLFFRARKAE